MWFYSMKKAGLFAMILVAMVGVYSFKKMEDTPKAKINWMTWQQVAEAQKKEPRKVVVDVYTGWCGWCKRMDVATYENPQVVKFINDNFYAIKFDAETREEITLDGKTYKFVPQGYRGYHELAAEILNGQISYPTTVYIDEKMNVIFPVPGFLEPGRFDMVSNYVFSNGFKTMKWEEFDKTFKTKVVSE